MSFSSNPTRRRRSELAAFVLVLAAVFVPPLAVFTGVAPPVVCLVSLFTVAYVLFMRMGVHGPRLMLIVALVAFVGTVGSTQWLNLSPPRAIEDDAEALAATWREKGPFDERLPLVVHIVFDEMMSSGAIDTQLPGGPALRDQMRDVSAAHGFRLFESIYSRFFFSGVSIPNLMDAEYAGRFAPEDVQKSIVAAQANNAYFADMASRGYRTAVFQSAVLDFCKPSEVRLCDTFASFDPATADESRLDGHTQALRLWDVLLRAFEPSYVSEYGRALMRRVYGLEDSPLGELGVADRFDVHAFPTSFDRLTRFVAGAPRGTHVFAHFLVPHSPYVLTPECVVTGGYDSGYYLGRRFDAADRDPVREKYYAQYFRQAQCVLAKVDEMMRAIEAVPAQRDAVVVIHGDHGSRISVGNYVEDYTRRDLIDNYGTFFAAKGPGIEPGIDCEFTSLPQIFRRIMARGALSGAVDSPLPVLTATRAAEGARVEVPMPHFGCAAGAPQH